MRIDQEEEEEVVAEDHSEEEAEDVKPSTGPLLSATNVTSRDGNRLDRARLCKA